MDQAAMQQAMQQTTNKQPALQGIFQKILQRNRQLVNSGNQPDDNSGQAAIAQAAATLTPNASDPLTQHGKALDGHEYDGLCEAYAEQSLLGHAGIYPSAIAAYQAHIQNGNIHESIDAPKGAQVFFNADTSNGNDGHTGVSNGDGTFTSATYDGVKTFNLKDWIKNTGQQYLGYAQAAQPE